MKSMYFELTLLAFIMAQEKTFTIERILIKVRRTGADINALHILRVLPTSSAESWQCLLQKHLRSVPMATLLPRRPTVNLTALLTEH